MGKRIRDNESQTLPQVEEDVPRQLFSPTRGSLVVLSLLMMVYLIFTQYRSRFIEVTPANTGARYAQLPSKSDEIPIPPHITLGRCANWTSNEESSANGRPSLEEFYVDLDHLSILTRGSLTSGSIVVTQSDGQHPIPYNKAKVTVSVVSFHEDLTPLDLVKVCSFRDQYCSADNGVGIFDAGRRLPDPSRRVQLFIVIHLPTIKSAPLQVRQFHLDTWNFSLDAFKLENVIFDIIFASLRTGSFHADSLSVRFGSIYTSGERIAGTYNVSQRLMLSTSNAPIYVNLNLHHHREGRRTSVALSSYKGETRALVNLITDVPNSNGSFSVDSSTTEGDVHIQILDAPIGHTLDLRSAIASHSAGKRNTVYLPPTFEGKYEMKGPPYPFRRIVGWDTDKRVEDPEGRNRTRVVQKEWEGVFVENGTISWQGGGDNRSGSERGSVQLKASLGRNRIVI